MRGQRKSRVGFLVPTALILALFVSMSGCQRIGKLFRKPPPEGLIEESYHISVFSYETAVEVAAAKGL